MICFFRLYFFLLFRVAWNFWLKVDIMSGIIETEVNRPLKVNVLVAQSCLVVCNPVVCAWNSLGKNIRVGCHSLLQGIFPTWERSWLSCIASRFFTIWATREAQVDLLREVLWASQVAQWVKNPPSRHEMQVQSLCREDLLEEGIATHSSTPAWRIPWTEEPGGLESVGSQRVWYDWAVAAMRFYVNLATSCPLFHVSRS